LEDRDWLARRFEENRDRLRAVAYRMLGSLNDADDAVQEAWLRLSRSDSEAVQNLEGWLTTVTGRVCLDMLRSRRSRREEALETEFSDPILISGLRPDPESEAIFADSVSLALLVVLETLTPQERLAFVLHDTFSVPFGEIARIAGCTPVAARQFASRARRRIRGKVPSPDVRFGEQRKIVDAFLVAVRDGNFAALIAVLHPDVVLRVDEGPVREMQGAEAIASQALMFSSFASNVQRVILNGVPGIISWRSDGRPFSLMGFTIRKDTIIQIEVIRDAKRLRQLTLSMPVGTG